MSYRQSSNRAAARTREAEGWQTAHPGPRRAARHPLRALNGVAVGLPAAGTGLRLRGDAGGGWKSGTRPGLAQTPPSFAQPLERSRPHRLITRFPGLVERARAKGGAETGKNPTDRGKPGTKCHVVVDRQGVPLAVRLGANVHDSQMILNTADAIEPIRRLRGRPRKRPKKLHADKAYDSQPLREELR